jgi:hypothetical protein
VTNPVGEVDESIRLIVTNARESSGQGNFSSASMCPRLSAIFLISIVDDLKANNQNHMLLLMQQQLVREVFVFLAVARESSVIEIF